MGEFKFNCPSCSQKLQGTEDWAGQQIQCPACQQTIQVPAAPEAAPKVTAKPTLGLVQHQKTAPPPVATFSHGTNPARHFSPSQAGANDSGKAAKVKRIVMIAACVLLLPPAGYFGYTAVRDYQAKVNVKRENDAKESDGGQLGHIASLYDALDKTDPAKHSTLPSSGAGSGGGQPARVAAGTNASGAVDEKLVAPKWTMEIEKVKLQRGKVNGNLGGTNFAVGSAFLDVSGTMNTLSLRQGTNAFADREVVITLRLRPGDTLRGQSWTIESGTRTNVPTVVKRTRPNLRYAPQSKTFANGYAMKLEFTQESDDLVQGRIYLALPDPEQSVIAGQFNAIIRRPRPVAAAPATTPQRKY